ncbi:hypothetical protein SAMN04487949_1557 [Halogranum gelatinilyticum]|uniref:Uncharacterized protein n=1 Tax=Halogranum gelatinilyticum TaxID=660521 RepID=A0A1G9SZ76_9EURY|nr:hypothetical protein [Halogranum gelatinilyticum]SDM40724.1 hypothetical protein SAMN04487949_1557 [Halogranum gelatinilyticum]
MGSHRIELLLTVQAMLLALVVHVLVRTTNYFGGPYDWLVAVFPTTVLLGGGLFVGSHAALVTKDWLVRDLQQVETE